MASKKLPSVPVTNSLYLVVHKSLLHVLIIFTDLIDLQKKRLNNNELQNVYLVDNDLNDKDPCRKSFSMSPPQHWLPRLPKRHRRKAVVCLVGGLCFLFGLAVPFMFGRSLGGAQGNSRSRLRSSSILLDDYKLDGVLSDLFISVKTTKKYHHPRLVILLETWVTLVKSQARRTNGSAQFLSTTLGSRMH